MDKLSVDDKNQMKDQNEPQVRNPNFRRQHGPPIPQVMPRGAKKPKRTTNQTPLPRKHD